MQIGSRTGDGMRTDYLSIAAQLVSAIVRVAHKHAISIPQCIADFMQHIVVRHLSSAHENYDSARTIFAKQYGPSHVFGGTQSSYFNRMITLINGELAGRNIGFVYGNEV